MVGQLYLFAVTVLLLFALAVAVPVLRDIVREGLERQRERESREAGTDSDGEDDAGPVGQEADETQPGMCQCANCGAVNESGFQFCQECAERL